MPTDTPSFLVSGGCHLDRTLHLQDTPVMGRTNPAAQQVGVGGVASNIARHLAARGGKVRFVGVQPPAELAQMEDRLRANGVTPDLLPLDGDAPDYTAILTEEGDLLVGAASMSLYDAVTADLLLPHLDAATPLVMDANFPEPVLSASAASLDDSRLFLVAATSEAKVGRLASCLSRLDALVLNRGEASGLTPAAPVAEMADALAARLRPGGLVLVSDGAGEAALASASASAVARPPPVELANANGAGDAMAAALFWGLVAAPDAGLAGRLDQALSAGAAFAAGQRTEPF